MSDVFESYVFYSIQQENYQSLLSNTKNDFYENSLTSLDKKKVEELLKELREMLNSSELTSEQKYDNFMESYNRLEKRKKMVDLLLGNKP